MRSKQRRDSGAALVEFALVLPVLLMILLGLITAGFALNEKQQMNHAAREGARFAAAVAPSQFATGWADQVRKVVVDQSAGTLVDANVCVSLVQGSADDSNLVVYGGAGKAEYTTSVGADPCIPGQDYPDTSEDNGLRVQVTASRPAEIELGLFGKYVVSMTVDATARSEFDA